MLEWLDTQMGIEQGKGPWTDRTRDHVFTKRLAQISGMVLRS